MLKPTNRVGEKGCVPRGLSVRAVGVCVAMVRAGCSSTGQLEQWRMTEQKAPSASAPIAGAPAQAVRVVFFRDGGSASRLDQPINLYINGHYQASLVGNTYTEQSLCPGAVRIAAQFNDVRQRYTTKTEGVPMTVGNQPVQYFRVSEDAVGNAVVNAVDGQAAQGATSLRLLQSHTLPRVVRAGCGQA